MAGVVLAVHDGLLAAALGVKSAEPLYRHLDLQRIRAERYRAENTPYPSWYLFGSEQKNISGLFKQYSAQGLQVTLCRESALPTLELQKFALLDVQFCTLRLPPGKPSRAPLLSGFLPVEFSSKINQADALYRQSLFRLLPVQRHYFSYSEPLLPPSEAEVWIVKYPFGSAGRCHGGHPYTVWQKAELDAKLPSLLAALPAGRQLIASEFIHHRDPYACPADHVVHKMPFFSERTSSAFAVRPYGSVCQRFLYRCRHDLLQLHKKLPLTDYTGQPLLKPGLADKIPGFAELTRQLEFHGQSRLIFSVDFLVPGDGIPRYLESNKLAATFAERFDSALPPLIDSYPMLQI
ncbi:MAG: hypothetical protein DDT21_00244 [Syntrophomonadaceae bacterium]|nr:hypothetical protein [Bacillota bacterium]